MKLKLECPKCGTVETPTSVEVFKRRRKLRLPFECPQCKGPAEKACLLTGPTDSQLRSRIQESRVAAREGGRRQPGSGARPGFEGDVRTQGKYRGECKLTRASSYRLKLEDLKKLELQARSGELPAFDIEFQSEAPAKRYVILPEWAYETLMTEAGRRPNTC